MAGWGGEHRRFLDHQNCDVWQLTGVRVDVAEVQKFTSACQALHVNAPLRRAAGN